MSQVKYHEAKRRRTERGKAKEGQSNNTSPTKHEAASRSDITIAVSLDALYNMRDYNPQKGQEPKLGPAVPFVKALISVDDKLKKQKKPSNIKVIIMIPESVQVDTKNATQYGSPMKYSDKNLFNILKKENTKLFLSVNLPAVKSAISQEIPAAFLEWNPNTDMDLSDSPLRVVFDGDGVIFSDEAEKVMQKEKLRAFQDHERVKRDIPLPEGPLKSFLEVLVKLQKELGTEKALIRTYLVTSRDALIAGYRVLNTLVNWELDIDEMMFLAGGDKGPILKAIKPHIFFDDDVNHIKKAQESGVIAALVPYGIKNQ